MSKVEEYLKKQARNLKRDLKSGRQVDVAGSLARIRRVLPKTRSMSDKEVVSSFRHSNALEVVAAEQGRGSWNELKSEVAPAMHDGSTPRVYVALVGLYDRSDWSPTVKVANTMDELHQKIVECVVVEHGRYLNPRPDLRRSMEEGDYEGAVKILRGQRRSIEERDFGGAVKILRVEPKFRIDIPGLFELHAPSQKAIEGFLEETDPLKALIRQLQSLLPDGHSIASVDELVGPNEDGVATLTAWVTDGKSDLLEKARLVAGFENPYEFSEMEFDFPHGPSSEANDVIGDARREGVDQAMEDLDCAALKVEGRTGLSMLGERWTAEVFLADPNTPNADSIKKVVAVTFTMGTAEVESVRLEG